MTRPFCWRRLALVIAAALVAAVAPKVDAQESTNAATFYRQAFASMADPSDPHWELVEHPDAVRIDASVAKFVARHDETFALLKKGAAAPRCDWGTDVREGTRARLPHLAAARKTANLTRLRSRVLVQQGRTDDALGDAVALLAFARHVGSDPLTIAKLTECGMAEAAVEAAAGAVAATKVDELKSLLDRLDHLPKSLPASEAIAREGVAIVAQMRQLAAGDPGAPFAEGGVLWEIAGGPRTDENLRARHRLQWADPKARDAGIAEAASLFNDGAAALAAPFDQSFVAVQKWEARRAAASPLAQLLVPSLRPCRVTVAAAETRVEMLYVAAMVKRDGPSAAASSREPHADGPFTYREVPGGFELESRLVVDNVPLRLTCRKSADELPF